MPAHLLAFFVSMAVWWAFPSADHVESLIMLCISLYVIAANYHRREIWPTMMMIGALAAVRVPYSYYFFDVGFYSQIAYCSGIIFFNCVLAAALIKYHCCPTLLKLVGADIQRPYIPQVLAMVMALLWSSISTALVMAELITYYFVPDVFSSGPPFFYRNYQVSSAFFHCIINLAVWSMMLDAHYLKQRIDKSNRAKIDI